MSVETRDREKVGTIEYEAGLMFNTEDEYWHGPCKRFDSLKDAHTWAAEEVSKANANPPSSGARATAYAWRFRFVPTQFADEVYGLVLDADAQRDLNFEWHYDGNEWTDESDNDAPEWEE